MWMNSLVFGIIGTDSVKRRQNYKPADGRHNARLFSSLWVLILGYYCAFYLKRELSHEWEISSNILGHQQWEGTKAERYVGELWAIFTALLLLWFMKKLVISRSEILQSGWWMSGLCDVTNASFLRKGSLIDCLNVKHTFHGSRHLTWWIGLQKPI